MGPDPNKARPNPDIPGLIYIKNTIKNPNIIVGDYTYYFDITGTDNFEDHVTNFYSFSRDKLIIGKFCDIATGIEFVMGAAKGDIIGWIALSAVSEREVYRGVAEISVYVDKNHQSKGVGSALIEYLKSKAPEYGFWSLFSAILEINTSSIRLHEKCEFRRIGYRERIAQDKFGNWQNTLLMEYRL